MGLMGIALEPLDPLDLPAYGSNGYSVRPIRAIGPLHTGGIRMPRRGHSQVESRHRASEKTIADAMAHSVDTNASLLKQAKQKCQNRKSHIKDAADVNVIDKEHHCGLVQQIQRLGGLLYQKKATESVESVQTDLAHLQRIAARAQGQNLEIMTHIVGMGAEMLAEADSEAPNAEAMVAGMQVEAVVKKAARAFTRQEKLLQPALPPLSTRPQVFNKGAMGSSAAGPVRPAALTNVPYMNGFG